MPAIWTKVAFKNRHWRRRELGLRDDEAETKSRLTDCFQALVEAKSQFYSVDSYLIDVTLVEATTIGASLREELSSNTPRNVLITAESLRKLASQEPQTLQVLREGLERGTTSIIGGLSREIDLPFLTHEGILGELNSGRSPLIKKYSAADRQYSDRAGSHLAQCCRKFYARLAIRPRCTSASMKGIALRPITRKLVGRGWTVAPSTHWLDLRSMQASPTVFSRCPKN